MNRKFVKIVQHTVSEGQKGKKVKRIITDTVFQVTDQNIYIITSGMHIDADGAPKAYHRNDAAALDYLKNAGEPRHWYGIVTDHGKTGSPVVQKESDPAPGYYVSATTLGDARKADSDPGRYVDATLVPYLVLPMQHFMPDFKLGDIGLVINKANGETLLCHFRRRG